MAAIPIIIGIDNRRSKLSDDSLFIRDDLISLNISTFKKVVNSPQLPLAIAKQGGLFIDIDGDKLARLRTEKGITRKDLADTLNITPKAVSHYEMKGMRPSVDHAQKMGEILGDSIVIPLDFFDHGKKIITSYRFDSELQKRILANRREFVKMINEIVEGTGYKVFWSKASPFDILIYKDSEDSKEILDYTLVGGTTLGTDINTRLHQIQGEFLREVPQDSAFIYDEEKLNVKDIKKESVPYIAPKELKTLENPKEFKKLINKRRLKTEWD
jgi:predicted transcriptional regulator